MSTNQGIIQSIKLRASYLTIFEKSCLILSIIILIETIFLTGLILIGFSIPNNYVFELGLLGLIILMVPLISVIIEGTKFRKTHDERYQNISLKAQVHGLLGLFIVFINLWMIQEHTEHSFSMSSLYIILGFTYVLAAKISFILQDRLLG